MKIKNPTYKTLHYLLKSIQQTLVMSLNYKKCFLISISLLTLVMNLSAQKIYLPKTEKNIYLFSHPKAQENELIPYKDTTHLTFKLPNIDSDIALYVGNAEINKIEFEDTTFYLGKYVSIKNLQDKEDEIHLILSKKYANKFGTLTSYNKSRYPYYVDLIIIPANQAFANKSNMVFKSKLGMFISIFFSGGVFVMLLYSLGNYFISGIDDFRNFTLFLLFLLIHQLIQTDTYLRFFIIFPENPIIYHQLIEGFNILINVFYLNFIIKFLEIKKKSKRLYKMIILIGYNLIIGGVLSLVIGFLLSDFELLRIITLITLAISVVFGIYITSTAYRVLVPGLSFYSITGSMFLFISVASEILYSHLIHDTYFWDIQAPIFLGMIPANFTHIGIFILILFFAMTLGIKYEEKDNLLLAFQELELNSMKEKIQMRGKNILKLKEDLALKQRQEIQQEELFQEMKNEFGSIKSHLNPIFISNILESIKINIGSKNKEQVKKQIKVFKQFLEHLLNLSSQRVIPLTKEIKSIELFLQLEKIRSNKNFTFKIDADDIDNKEDLRIPPFLLQQYMEVMIWGVKPNATPLIALKFTRRNESFVISISSLGEISNFTYSRLNQMADGIISKISKNLNIQDKDLSFEFNAPLHKGSSRRSLIISIPYSALKSK